MDVSIGYKFGMIGTNEEASAISTILSSLYGVEFRDYTKSKSYNSTRLDKENSMLVKYFSEREGIKLSRRKKSQGEMYNFQFKDCDSAVFAGTQIVRSNSDQRDFLFDLRINIEQRHKQKREGFMSLIRK